jgi:triosephosphate isomerase
VAAKVRAVVAEGMSPILCVGEKERDEEGRYFEILKNQVAASLARLPRSSFRSLIIAYEPLWAIGKSAREAMAPRAIFETAIFIRKALTDLVGAESAQAPQILYGGSVEEENTAAILAEGGVAGLLVGHKSLEPDAFITILKHANAA